MRTSIKRLGNGLTVLINTKPSLQTVYINFGIRYGSVYENPSTNGAAHFLEHMLFKGTKKRNWREIDELAREVGAYVNAFTDYETTIFTMSTYKKNFERILDLISDMVIESTLPEEVFEKERGAIMSENSFEKDNPRDFALSYLPSVLFKKHPARMNPGGDNERAIKLIKRKQLHNLYKSHYTPKNSVLAIYGDIEKKYAFELVQKYFSKFSGKYRNKELPMVNEKLVKREVTIKRKGIKQERLVMGFRCPTLKKDEKGLKEHLALLILTDLLNRRLFEEIREKYGLSYDPRVLYYPYTSFSFIAADVGIEPKHIKKVKAIILNEFQKIKYNKINKEELEKTINKLNIGYKLMLDNSMLMNYKIVWYYLLTGNPSIPTNLSKILNTVSTYDLNKVVNKFIDLDKFCAVTLQPTN